MGLVEDHHLVLGQDGAAAGQMGAVEVGVDDDHVGFGGPGPSVLGKAVAPRGAPECSWAFAGRGRDHRPCPEVGLEGQLGPVPEGGVIGPLHQAAHLVGDGGRIQGVDIGLGCEGVVSVGWIRGRRGEGELRAAAADLGDPLPAGVVAPALEHGEGEAVVGDSGYQGQVLIGQLILECFGGGGHHHPLTGQCRRNQVGQRFAGTGAGLDNQVAPAAYGGGHGYGHLDLPRSGLAAPGKPGGHLAQCGGHLAQCGGDLVGHPPTLPGGVGQPAAE